jgi:hypothetical protein
MISSRIIGRNDGRATRPPARIAADKLGEMLFLKLTWREL